MKTSIHYRFESKVIISPDENSGNRVFKIYSFRIGGQRFDEIRLQAIAEIALLSVRLSLRLSARENFSPDRVRSISPVFGKNKDIFERSAEHVFRCFCVGSISTSSASERRGSRNARIRLDDGDDADGGLPAAVELQLILRVVVSCLVPALRVNLARRGTRGRR